MMLEVRARVVAGRVLLYVGERPPAIVGREERCPCCGSVFLARAHA